MKHVHTRQEVGAAGAPCGGSDGAAVSTAAASSWFILTGSAGSCAVPGSAAMLRKARGPHWV